MGRNHILLLGMKPNLHKNSDAIQRNSIPPEMQVGMKTHKDPSFPLSSNGKKQGHALGLLEEERLPSCLWGMMQVLFPDAEWALRIC